MRRWFFIISGILLIAGAAAVFLLTMKVRLDDGRLDEQGIETRGTVIARRTLAAPKGLDDGFRLTIRYRTAAGEHREREMPVSPSYYTAHARGSALRLRYLKDDPGVVELRGLEPGPWRHLAGALAAAALAVAGAALVNRSRRRS